MIVAVASDHGGRPLQAAVVDVVVGAGHEALVLTPGPADPGDDYPDVARMVASALNSGRAARAVVICGSGAGVTVAANKLPLVRAALAHDSYTAHQMVEHDHVNVLTLGARVIGPALAAEVVSAFLGAVFTGEARHARRLAKVLDMEGEGTVNALQHLHDVGQSVWLDNIRKDLLTTGTLARYLADFAVTGVTSNPTILEQAISGSADYDDAIRAGLARGVTDPERLVFALALEDLVAAADLLRGVFDATGGSDGYVSVEVSPGLAHDTPGTVAAGRALFAEADRPNVLIKVPGTPAGLGAVEELIALGIPVNVTLLFSPAQYLDAAGAYLRGLERRQAQGLPLGVGSVASVFVSRWDRAADPDLPADLHGQLGIAAVQKTFAAYTALGASERWQRLAAGGALPQKVLWASTSTKDPNLPDTYYLGRLAAPGTVDTVPEPTLLAFAGHGVVCDLLQPDEAAADEVIALVAKEGVDFEALARELQTQGAEAFSASWAALLACIEHKTATLAGTAP